MELDQAIVGFCLSLRAAGRSQGTERSYSYLLAQWGRWLQGGDRDWATASEQDVDDFLEEYGSGHDRTSTALFGTCIRSFYRWAVRRKLVAVSPAADLPPGEPTGHFRAHCQPGRFAVCLKSWIRYRMTWTQMSVRNGNAIV